MGNKDIFNSKENNSMGLIEVVEHEIWFEPDYEDIKFNPNAMYFKYENNIRKLCAKWKYLKSFDFDELYQQAYIHFIELCKKYDPYYNDGFIPFAKFFYSCLEQKLRAYIQHCYFKANREQITDFSVTLQNSNNLNNEFEDGVVLEDKTNVEDGTVFKADFKAFKEALPDERQAQIIDLLLEGMKQQEIADKLGMSQSRVNIIKNNLVKNCIAYSKNEPVNPQYLEVASIIAPYLEDKNFKGINNKFIEKSYKRHALQGKKLSEEHRKKL